MFPWASKSSISQQPYTCNFLLISYQYLRLMHTSRLFPAVSKKISISTQCLAVGGASRRHTQKGTNERKERELAMPCNRSTIHISNKKSRNLPQNTRPCPSCQVQQGVGGYPIEAASRLLETAKTHKQGLLWGRPSALAPTRSRSQSFQQSAELNAKFLDGQPQSDLFRQPEPFRCQNTLSVQPTVGLSPSPP